MTEQPDQPASRRLAIDEQTESADPALPAFLARPAGVPVYHGFPVIDGAEGDGFRLGMITDFLSESALEGDAYVIAPDGSRAGLVWESGCAAYLRQALAPEEARSYLATLVPELRLCWQSWRDAATRP